MLDKVLTRIMEAVLALLLLCGAFMAFLFADWCVKDEYFLFQPAIPAESYVLAEPLYVAPSLFMMALYALFTWRMLTGRARCNMKVVAALFLLGIAAFVLWLQNAPAVFAMPGWFALLAKSCMVIVGLFPAAWLFLPQEGRSEHESRLQPEEK